MACSSCGSTNCSSGLCSSCSSSIPYYSQTGVCAEDHCQKIYQQQFFFSVCPQVSWNVPLCGQTAILSVPGVAGAVVGSFLWNEVYGYFEINSVDSARGQIGIVNNCTVGNASPGTQIPACTCFIVTVPPAVDTTQSGNCLTVDFTAPALDDCIDITLNSTTGLTASDTIQIGTGFYFIEEVKPDNIITICNHGEGITPGTPVIAYDANGNFQYCVSVISSNPCDRDAESPGKVLICGENGITVPLDGNTPGWVVTLEDGTTDEASYQPLGANGACTTLSAPFTFTIAVASYVDIAVVDSTMFAVGDGVQFDGYTTDVLVITGITDGTHISGTFEVVPGFTVVIPAGTRLCLRSCCEDIYERLDNQGINTVTSTAVAQSSTSVVVTTPGNIVNAGPFTNTSGTPLNYVATIEYIWAGLYILDEITATIAASLILRPYYAVVTGAIGTTANPVPVLDPSGPLAIYEDVSPDSVSTWEDINYGSSYSIQISGSIAAGQELRVSAQARLEVLQIQDGIVSWFTIQAKITTLRITV